MPRKRLGPWGKLYASLDEDTAHYTDAQFRAWIGILCRAITNRGELPKLRPLTALYGASVAFLVDEGRLCVTVDNAVSVCGWSDYQAPVDATVTERVRRFRERERADGNAVPSVSKPVSVTGVPTSTSTSSDSPTKTENDSYPAPESERDSLDTYHELTNGRPWGKRVGGWLRELEEKHGLVHVQAALIVESKAGLDRLVERATVRLERQADRVEVARKAAERPLPPPPDPPAPEPTAEEIEAGRAAWEALRPSLAAAAIRPARNGASQRVGAVLGSLKDGSARKSPTVTRDEVPDRKSRAVGSEANSFAPQSAPSAAGTAVRMNGATEAPKLKES